MLIIDCFHHNIVINDKIVGFIGENELFAFGKKIADISDDGIISIDNKEIGYVDEDGSIYINNKEVGYIDGGNNFVFIKPLGF